MGRSHYPVVSGDCLEDAAAKQKELLLSSGEGGKGQQGLPRWSLHGSQGRLDGKAWSSLEQALPRIDLPAGTKGALAKTGGVREFPASSLRFQGSWLPGRGGLQRPQTEPRMLRGAGL